MSKRARLVLRQLLGLLRLQELFDFHLLPAKLELGLMADVAVDQDVLVDLTQDVLKVVLGMEGYPGSSLTCTGCECWRAACHLHLTKRLQIAKKKYE